MKNGFAKPEEETAEDTKEIKEDEDVELSETERLLSPCLNQKKKRQNQLMKLKDYQF